MTTNPTPTTRRPGSLRKVLAALLATVATSATLIPIMATPAAAAATTMTFRSCSSMTVGSTLTCTVRITDSADKSDPQGTVTFSLSNLANSEIRSTSATCTLAGQSGGSRSDCSVVLSAWSTGSLTVSASYSSSNTSNWSNSSRSTTVTVGAGSSFRTAFGLKALRDQAISSTAASAGSSSSAVTFDVYGFNCDSDERGYELVTGAASGTPSNPTSVETPTVLGPFSVSSGRFTFSVTIPTNHPKGVFRGAFVCASSKPTRGSSSSISATGPVLQMTISGTSGSDFSAFSRSADDGRVVLGSATIDDPADDTDGRKIELSVNQDDLNPVDKVNIVKEGADLLKARVDALVPASSVVSRIGYTLVEDGVDRATLEKWTPEVAAGRADPGAVSNALAVLPAAAPLMTAPAAEFVTAVYTRALGRTPSADELAAVVVELNAGRVTRAGLVAAATSSQDSVTRWRYRSYVAAAFQALTAKIPTDGQLGQFVGELEAGGYKVNTVEGIALLGASAADWNSAAPAGRTPASAVFTVPGTASAPAAGRPPVAAPRPAAGTPAAPKAAAKRRATASKSRTAAVRKAAAKKAAMRKAAVRKAAAKKAAARKAAAKKAAARKAAERRAAAARR
jgi:hypothetical protein